MSSRRRRRRSARASTRSYFLALGIPDVLDLVRRELLDADLAPIGTQRVQDLIELHVDRRRIAMLVVLEEVDEEQRGHPNEKVHVADALRGNAQRRQEVERDHDDQERRDRRARRRDDVLGPARESRDPVWARSSVHRRTRSTPDAGRYLVGVSASGRASPRTRVAATRAMSSAVCLELSTSSLKESFETAMTSRLVRARTVALRGSPRSTPSSPKYWSSRRLLMTRSIPAASRCTTIASPFAMT